MTLQDFVNEWNGRYTTNFPYIDPKTHKVSYQCIGLLRQWITEGLGLPANAIPPAVNAKQMFLNFPEAGNQYFTKVHNNWNDINQFPPPGALIFWGFAPFFTGPDGHVSICSTGTTGRNIISFDQNWGNPNFCRYVNHSYYGVLGWLTPKK